MSNEFICLTESTLGVEHKRYVRPLSIISIADVAGFPLLDDGVKAFVYVAGGGALRTQESPEEIFAIIAASEPSP